MNLCPRIVLTNAQEKEAAPHLRSRAGHRFAFQQIPFIQRLEDAGKLHRLAASSTRPLAKTAQALFTGGLADDKHLYEAAIATDRIVITEDADQLGARHEITRRTGVAVYSVEEALAAETGEA